MVRDQGTVRAETDAPRVETITGPDGARVRVVWASRGASGAALVAALGVSPARGVLVCNGGTNPLPPAIEARLATALGDGVARVAAQERLTMVTGATDAGVFHLLGQGIARWGQGAPVIGVAVADLVAWPVNGAGGADLERHHTHFVLVRGEQWGDETPALYAVAAELSRNCPSLALFAGGGEGVLSEMEANVVSGRAMLLLAGSGRSTDAVLDAWRGLPAASERIATIARNGEIYAFDLARPPAALAEWVRRWVQAHGTTR